MCGKLPKIAPPTVPSRFSKTGSRAGGEASHEDAVTLPTFLRFFSVRAGLARSLEAPDRRTVATEDEQDLAAVLQAALNPKP